MTGTYEPVYRAQGGASTAMQPGASPEAFGADVGKGLEDLGGAVDRAVIQHHEIEVRRNRESQSADRGAALAKITGDVEAHVQDLRANAQPGAAGHTAEVNSVLDQYQEGLLAPITDRHVLNAYREQFAAMRERVATREYGWETGQRIEHDVTNLEQTSQGLATALAVNPDNDAWGQGLSQVATAWQGANVGADVREHGVREGQRLITLAYAKGLVRTDHAALSAQLGSLSPYLQSQDIIQLREEAETEQRRDEAAARANAAEGRAHAEQQYNLFHTRIANGDELTDQEFDQYDAAAAASGAPAHQYDARVARVRQGINHETDGWTPPQWEQSINALEAKRDRTPDENIRLDQLRTIRAQRIAEFNADPQGHAARTGNLAPTVADYDHVTPPERDAAVTWARGYAHANHMAVTPYLPAAQMQHYRERLDSGGDGAVVDVARNLRNNWGVPVGTEISRQLGDHAAEVTLMVGLPEQTLNHYANGRQALERNAALFDQHAASDIFLENQEAIPPQFRQAAFKAARNIVAGMLDAQNQRQFDPDIYRMALHRALGALQGNNGMTGGIAVLNGAHVWLPPQISQADAERRIATATSAQWAHAAVDERGRPTGEGAHYVGPWGIAGRPLYTGELGNTRFRTISPGVYTIDGAVDRHGRPWRFDIRRLGQ